MKIAKFILFIVACSLLPSCAPIKAKDPQILFSTEESEEKITSIVLYKYHRFEGSSAFYPLDNIDDLRKYKMQVELLLKNISVAEAKMLEKEQDVHFEK